MKVKHPVKTRLAILLAGSIAALLVSFAPQYSHASQLDDIQEELETQSFENDMRHDEEMDAINGRRAQTYNEPPHHYWADGFGIRHDCAYDKPLPILGGLFGAHCP